MSKDYTMLEVDLRDDGLLWLINRVVFHPRGFALAVNYDVAGESHFWLMGNGSEPWLYDSDDYNEDDLFGKIEACFAKAKAQND